MIGAVQAFNGGKTTTWMDEIIAPCRRRDAWLSRLSCPAGKVSLWEKECEDLDSLDKEWVALHSALALEAAAVLHSEMGS